MTGHTSTSRNVWRAVTVVALLCVAGGYRPAIGHGEHREHGQRGQQRRPGQQTQTSQIPAHPNELVFPTLEYTLPKATDHRHVLSNGVVVFVVEDHTLPLVDISVLVRTGEYLDPPDKVGLAGLAGSQMRAGGTASLTPSEFDEEAAFLAAQIGASIGATQGGASLGCLTKDLDAGLELFFEMLGHPRFDPGRLDLAKSQALQQMQRRNDRTSAIEGREWGRLMRGDAHFTTSSPTQASIDTITRDDLVAFHQRYYHPGGFIFTVSGDVETEEILAKLAGYMAGWEASTRPVPLVPKPEHALQPGLYLVDKPDVNQGRVSLGHLGTTRDNPDRSAILIMMDILGGGGFTSRLVTRVRSDEGLAYSVGGLFGMGVYYDGVFTARFESRSETVARATAIVLEEIERIRTEPVSEAELRTAIASFVDTFSQNFSSAASTAGLFASDEYTGRDPSYLETYRERLSAVTVADVQRVAREYLDPNQLVILSVGNIEDILTGDPDNPDYSMEALTSGPVTRIPLPDPLTMEYPAHE